MWQMIGGPWGAIWHLDLSSLDIDFSYDCCANGTNLIDVMFRSEPRRQMKRGTNIISC